METTASLFTFPLEYYFLNTQLAINFYKDKLFCIEYYELRWGLLVQIF